MAPTAQDRLKHAKEVAEWRINQGRRILDVQGRINDFEKQVQRSMQILSDTTYSQYKVGKNLLPEINSVCEDIEAIYSALENSRAELEAIKIEEAPSLEESSQVYSGLVCPECGKKLTGKFCPVHGNEGIKEAVTYTTSSAAESDLICPECSRPVMDKFCVNCGVEGVKKTSEVEFNSTKAAAKSKEPPAVKEEKSEEEVLICPDCGKELKDGMKFCNEHGKAGVPKSKMPAQKTATKKEEPPAKRVVNMNLCWSALSVVKSSRRG